jgi:hypothetical protein
LKCYKVTTLYAADADALFVLCVKAAAGLSQTAEFKPRTIDWLDNTTNLLMRQCKAHIIGLLEADDLYVDMPNHLSRPLTQVVYWDSPQTHWFTHAKIKPYSVPAFKWNGEITPVTKIPEVLHYECLNDTESCDMYRDILTET